MIISRSIHTAANGTILFFFNCSWIILCCQDLSCAFNVGNHPWPLLPRCSIPCHLPAVSPDIVKSSLGKRDRNHTHTHWNRLPHNNGERVPWVPPVSFVGNTVIQAARWSASSDTSPGSPLGYEQSISDARRTLTLFLQSHSQPGVPLSRKAGTSTDDNPGEETRTWKQVMAFRCQAARGRRFRKTGITQMQDIKAWNRTPKPGASVPFRSVAQSCLTLWLHGQQHTRPPCPSPTPRVYSNSCPLSQWCHPTISSSVAPFSSRLQSFPASGFFPVSQQFTSGGQRTGVSASASVLPMDIQDWFPLGWTGWISLQSRGLSRVLSITTVQKHQFFVLSFLYRPTLTSYMTTGKTRALTT